MPRWYACKCTTMALCYNFECVLFLSQRKTPMVNARQVFSSPTQRHIPSSSRLSKASVFCLQRYALQVAASADISFSSGGLLKGDYSVIHTP